MTALRARVGAAWSHPRYGWLVKSFVLYVGIIEVALQLLFGRINVWFVDVGFLEVGRQAAPIPPEVIANGMVLGSLYALVAMGLILVYRANRIINFAQAQLGAVPAVIALLLIAKRGVPYLAVLPIVIIGAAVLGAGTEALIVRRFSKAPRLIVTVVTIGVGILLVVMEFFAKLASDAGQTLQEAEHDFFKYARPTSLLQRLIDPAEVAAMVTYVCSPRAAATNGAALRVEGGVVRTLV